MTSQLKGLQL